MRRLIYAPKAYIFIRSSNMGGIVYDVSADVTSGSVTQKCNDLSEARFTLRNRYRKWIRDPDSGKQIFLPMDMVTIWLQRIAGRPIQVFTGYLNEVPYYQGYPGDAIFSASCTLKKLTFTWFDPGLPFFQQWVMSNDGWYITADGDAQNPVLLTPDQVLQPGAKLSSNSRTTGQVNDGGFDALLGRFLVEVAGWANEDILISSLPKDIPKLAARLYADVNKNSTADLKVLENALAQTMGINGWTNANPATATTSNNSPALSPTVMQVISTMKKEADTAGINVLIPAFTAYVQTRFDPNHEVDPGQAGTQGYGLYSMTANGTTTQSTSGGPQGPAGPAGPGAGLPSIDGIPVANIVGDVKLATQVFCARLNTYPDLVKAARSLSLNDIQKLVQTALGIQFPSNVSLPEAFLKVKQYCHSAVVKTTPNEGPSQTIDPGSLTFSDKRVQNLLTDAEKAIVRNQYKSAQPWLAGILYRAKQISNKITISRPIGTKDSSSICLTGPNTAMLALYTKLGGDASIDSVDARINGREYRLQFGQLIPGGETLTNSSNMMVVTQTVQPTAPVTASAGSGPSASNGSGGDLMSGLVTLSANAAFAAQFAFPSNVIESISLTGNRALMNDVSCLDGVKQFCQASLRSFRSLPDGRFLAFYPDYFGATRKPYWQIYNIEITNFGIQLNDEALATHVYVVGDTFAGDGQISWEDMVSTRGVATITQAFMLNSFIEPYTNQDNKKPLKPDIYGRLVDAYEFLQHYGARPYEEDQPLIRNVFYEFLLAWQRFMQLWAQTFATECTFTFQPEVMAGGLIAFPDHGVQMYCDAVTHEWSYTDGFQTSATLVSPSLLPGKQRDHFAKPGFALAGNINTIGT